MITREILRAVTGCTQDAADLYAEHLSEACDHYGINTPERLAAFLAQIGHESGSLRHAREIWGPTPAQVRYEGRVDLGNTQFGDGARYLGRGLIQITGRANYRETADRMRAINAPDFEDQPAALEQPRWAAWAAADWWAAHGCNQLADLGNFEGLTRRINGGLNGIEDRKARWERAKTALAISAPPTSENAPTGRPNVPASEWELNNPPPPKDKPMAPFIIPAVVELAKLIPRLGGMFGGSEVAQRNVAAAGVVVDAVVGAVGAANAQEAVEMVQTDTAAREAATKAVEGVWYQISEAGGGGIEGARKADLAASTGGDLLRSPSFWALMMLLPLVYLLVLSLIGLIGTATWSDDVRAGLAGSIVSAVIGGAVGYYWGQTTSRNRTPAP